MDQRIFSFTTLIHLEIIHINIYIINIYVLNPNFILLVKALTAARLIARAWRGTACRKSIGALAGSYPLRCKGTYFFFDSQKTTFEPLIFNRVSNIFYVENLDF